VLQQHTVGPNLVEQARRAGVPLVLADARMVSPAGSARGVAAALHRQVLAGLDTVLAQTAADAQHLREAGAPSVKVTGGLAFDQTPPARRLARGLLWRQALARPVILAAGTCEGEEAGLLRAWLAQRAPRPLLVIVPRDARRFDDVAVLVREAGWSLLRRSSFGQAPPAVAARVDVWLGDTAGEMPTYYGAADVALLGGSFTPGAGTQDLVEACACGCPGVIGPFTAGSERAMSQLLGAGAARRADDLAEAVALAVAIAGDGNRNEWVQRAFAFARSHRGAAQRMADEVLRIFNARGRVGPH
jgi:3-deoxy-D-manno-octulosonic-acid transferase